MQREDIVGSYKVAEFATLARDGSPVCWPLTPELERGRIVVSTGYMYPTKARNAKRDPRVAALFSDPTASGRSDEDPLVLVQGIAEVFDQDIQRNTERYVDQLLHRGPLAFRVGLSLPPVRRAMAGYLARIFIEVTPRREHVWARESVPAADVVGAPSRPATFVPGPPIELPKCVQRWLPRYARPPVLAYIDADGWPAIARVEAAVRSDHIEITRDLAAVAGAPACLTYHRLVGNYRANDAFLIRGHFDAIGRLIPERIVGFGGIGDDRGLGSRKLIVAIGRWGRRLPAKLAAEGRPPVTPRPSLRA